MFSEKMMFIDIKMIHVLEQFYQGNNVYFVQVRPEYIFMFFL